ncbi:Uncharacterised protein [uncultured archaeon]|nr:Uncharacterised protein [uncultured archaeon]
MGIENQKDIEGNSLFKEEQINLIYQGPSFDGKMELPQLTAQLRSTDIMIRELISDLYRRKKLANPEKTKIYLELKKGSFEEIISVVFNHPLTVCIVGTLLANVIWKYLNKEEKIKEKEVINNISGNSNIVNNINFIINPLQNEKDRLVIQLPKSKEETIISFNDIQTIRRSIQKIKEETKIIEIYEEKFYGILNSVNYLKEKYGFILEGTEKIIPVNFDEKLNLNEIKNILAETLEITARATYENSEIKKLEIITYKIKERKNLKDFLEKNNGQ